MKPVSEVVACVVDYGTFIDIAERLSRDFAKVNYHSPIAQEFQNLPDCIKGDGVPGVTRVDDFMEPAIIEETDLFIFPDIGFGGVQRYLRSIGKAVWGSMGLDELELYRSRFLKFLEAAELPRIHSETIRGVSALAEHLKRVEDKWVKVNRFRAAMETWHHQDWLHSAHDVDRLAVKFGPLKEKVVFVVQDAIESDMEIGYDGWSVDGNFPVSSFQGYEKKNELYLGCHLTYEELPKQVREINEALAPVLKASEYRNFIATEIRIAGEKPYFIDPTMRMPGQTGEQLLETCENLAACIWHGANGELVEPIWTAKYAVSATLHYKSHEDDKWSTIVIPDEARQWLKVVQYCEADGAFHFPPGRDDLGVVIGIGDTVEEAIDHLKDNVAMMDGEPVSVDLSGFGELIESVEEAKGHGMSFGDSKLPDPAELAVAE